MELLASESAEMSSLSTELVRSLVSTQAEQKLCLPEVDFIGMVCLSLVEDQALTDLQNGQTHGGVVSIPLPNEFPSLKFPSRHLDLKGGLEKGG